MQFKVHDFFTCMSCHQLVFEKCKKPSRSRCKACKRKQNTMWKQIERNKIQSDPKRYADYLEYNRQRTRKINLKPESYQKRLERGLAFARSPEGKAYYKKANKEWNKRNPEKRRQTARKYRITHREKMREKERRRYADPIRREKRKDSSRRYQRRHPEVSKYKAVIAKTRYYLDPEYREKVKERSRKQSKIRYAKRKNQQRAC